MKTTAIVLCALAAALANPGYAGKSAPKLYVPGMGETMGATQMRHEKLWYAGAADNWDLAQYELDELGEGFEDAVAYHPKFKNDARIADLLPRFVTAPLEGLGKAVKAQDKAKFVQAFDGLTEACNGCHAATGMGFIEIQRPIPGAYNNQAFAARKP